MSEWISVETEPPMSDAGESDWKYKTSGELLIYSPTVGMQKAVLEYSDKFNQWRFANDDDIYEIDDVSHWMKLPEPPKD